MELSTRIRDYIRSNLLGLVAIYLALGGTALATHPGGANTISTADIVDGQVTSPDLGNNAVSTGKIADGSVANADLGANAVSTTKILDGHVAGPDVAAGAVNSVKVADDTLTSADILNGTIQSADLSSAAGTEAVGPSQLRSAAVTIPKLSFDPATQVELNAHKTAADHDGRYFTEAELSTGDGSAPNAGVNRVNWQNLTAVPAGFADGTDNIGTTSGTAGGDLTGTYPNPTIGAGKVTGSKIGLPLTLTGTFDGALTMSTNNSPSAGAAGLRGNTSNGYGVRGIASGTGSGVSGHALGASGRGVSAGASATDGVALEASATDAATKAAQLNGTVSVDGLTEESLLTASNTYGGSGLFEGTEVRLATGSGTAFGGQLGISAYAGGDHGAGITGSANGYRGLGVVGSSDGEGGIGTKGTGSGPGGIGVYGQTLSSNNGTGVFAEAHFAGDTALVANTRLSATQAATFNGNVAVNGALSKSGGSFRIDHPLDPANQYLQHSFVESPDMKNIYDGIVTTDERGFAEVEMPAWFSALNRSFRYQLTVHGRSFARAIVWRELSDNRFTIRTDEPRTRVSWQVTGIRHDAYATANRIEVEVPKQGDERGRYLYPRLFGAPASREIAP